MFKFNSNNNAVINTRVAMATPTTLVADACFVAGEALTKVSKAIAGEQGWVKVPGHKYADRHATGLVLDFDALMKKAEEKTKADKEEKDHSDMVEWKKGKWVPSAKATEKAKEAGYEQAFLPQMYKTANWLIRIAKDGADKVYNEHCYAYWCYMALFGHVEYMSKKGVKNADSKEKVREYFEQACKHSKLDADKLISFESLVKLAKADFVASTLAHTEEAEEEQLTVEEGREILAEVEAEEQEEARDGRAPKTEAKAKFNINQLVHKAGCTRLKADNAWEVANKAKAAFDAKKLTKDEFEFVVNACIDKDASESDPEEYLALMEG